MLELYTRTGIVSADTIANVVRFTQATRKNQEHISVSDITDWTFAKKANEETETIDHHNVARPTTKEIDRKVNLTTK
jgi:hypothetical protein